MRLSLRSLVAPLLHLDELIGQLFLVQHRLLVLTCPLPGRDVRVLVVVA